MKKTWFILSVLVSLYLIVSLIRSIWQLYKSGDQVLEFDKIRQVELRKNTELKQELEATKSADFIERAAHDKLNMVRPGEAVLIVPDSGIKDEKITKEVAVIQEPNFRKWIRLFE